MISPTLIKWVASKAGYNFTGLHITHDNTVIAEVPTESGNPWVIADDFKSTMQDMFYEQSQQTYTVNVKHVEYLETSIRLIFTVESPDLQPLSTPTPATKSPPVGSLVVTPSRRQTGQITGYSNTNPELAHVRWYQTQRDNATVSWTHINDLRVIMPGNDQDTEIQDLMDKEAEVHKPVTQNPHGTYDCACGCGGLTRYYFCAGHDMRAKGKLKRKMEGGERTWDPSQRLIDYVLLKPEWKARFGDFVKTLAKKE